MRVSRARPSALLLLVALAGCGARSTLEMPEPDEDAGPQPIQDPRPQPIEYVTVGGCNSFCEGGCSYPGLVVGTRLDTMEIVIPSDLLPEDFPSGSGFSCTADLPRGVALSLEARVEPGFRFVRWSASLNDKWAPCPCLASIEPICNLIVDGPVYCGAVYREQ